MKGIDSGAGLEGGREKTGHGKRCFQSLKLSRGFTQTSSNRGNSDSKKLAPAHKSHSFVIASEKNEVQSNYVLLFYKNTDHTCKYLFYLQH